MCALVDHNVVLFKLGWGCGTGAYRVADCLSDLCNDMQPNLGTWLVPEFFLRDRLCVRNSCVARVVALVMYKPVYTASMYRQQSCVKCVWCNLGVLKRTGLYI